MANLGIGIGSFLSGLNQGVQAYNTFQDARDRKQLRNIATEGTAQARGLRDQDIQKAVTVGSADQNGMTVPTYEVGGKAYANQDAANAAAEKQVGTFMDYYAKTVMPRYQQHWMETGQVDKAQAMDKWMQDENVKKGAKAWAGAVRSFQVGDREGFKDNLLKAYNQQGYFDDGYTASKIDDVTNDKGQLLGYAITFKDADGNETTQNYDGDDVAKLALQAMAPDQVLSYGLDQLKQRDAVQAKLAVEARGLSNDLVKLERQHSNTLDSQTNQSNLRRAEEQEKVRLGGSNNKVTQANQVANALRANGMADADIRALYPQLLGVERASRSRQDRLDGYISTLSKANLEFNDLPTEQKVAQAQALMDSVDGAAKPQQAAPTQRAANAGNPVQSGRGVPLIDTKTNQIFYQ